ncbi:Aste57867_18008 [Aphanomyces stellatus]|uniref:Aste57867_18008 protein n=1 Tax=Aphanomyces stellatus TaxID=120398 RepID=A0A485L9A4_9STRA|nr:hypothetical protein As57867_017946 [Aphanomyces stellatus]VFT94747.1 Aste57867_18008 [Aphanomyces stellatus]
MMPQQSGRSLLNEALSPTGRQILNDFFEASAGSRSMKASPVSYTFQTLPLLTEVTCLSRQVCDVLHLTVNLHGSVIVSKILQKKSSSKDVLDMENMGLIRKDDVLVSINKRPVDDMDDAHAWLQDMPLPLTLVFSRNVVRKNTLGEYSLDDLRRHAEHNRCRLLERHSPSDVAQMLHMMIQFTNSDGSYRLLKDFILDAEAFFLPTSSSTTSLTSSFDTVKGYIHKIHEFMAGEEEAKKKRWLEDKAARAKRLESMQRQLKVLEAKLAAAQQGESMDLRSLVDQLKQDVEQSKQLHYLPACEGFTLRFGTGGVYAGVGDVWISSYHTSFTIETQRSAPQVLLRLTPLSDTGLKIRAMNFKVYTEGRMLVPTFQVDEINLEVQFSAEIPLVFDAGCWRVQADALDIHFASVKYYERAAQSNVPNKTHDSVMKTFLNRIVPSVVEDAAASFLCAEVGGLLLDGRAKVRLSGDVHIEGRNLNVFDASLGSSGTSDDEAADARALVGCTPAQGDLLLKLYKLFVPKSKKLSHLSIRELVEYGVRMRQSPSVRALLASCWQVAVHVCSDGGDDGALDFIQLMDKVEQVEGYPVDVSFGFHSTNIRVDLCEAAAATYTALERILRQKMTSSPERKQELETRLQALDSAYNDVNVLLSTVASRVDELVVLVSGGLPAGIHSQLSFEATEMTCKGPWQASFDIPLTTKKDEPPPPPTDTPKTKTRAVVAHDQGDLVVHYFVQSPGDIDEQEVQVRVQDASFKVLLDVPTEAQLGGHRLTAMELKLDTGAAPPNVSLSMGDFAKCAISCKRLAFCSPMWTVVKLLGKYNPGLVVDYLESPFFAFSLNFFTSLQVTPEQMYWTLNSASLSESLVSYVTHRVCVSQLLRDMSKKESETTTHATDHHAAADDVDKQRFNRSQSTMPDAAAAVGRPGGPLMRQDTFFGDDDPRRRNMFTLDKNGAAISTTTHAADDEPLREPLVEVSGEDDAYYF